MESDDLVSQFQAITQETEERSRFYLEAVNWELTAALSSYYDNAGDSDEPMPEIHEGASAHTPSAESSETDDKKGSVAAGNRRFHSLADYHEEKTGDESEEEGQEFYAGGSAHSGEVIVGPGRKKTENVVKDIFESARKHGAVEKEETSFPKKQTSYFSGSGYKLGEKEDDHQLIPGDENHEKTPLNAVLKLWKDGFTVGDGHLRPYHDEESREFIRAVSRGEIPQELLRLAKGGEVHIDMEDHKEEDYKPVKKKMVPFTGEGHTLGSVTPKIVMSQEPKPTQSSSVDVDIDNRLPITTVRIQLGDGRRVTKKFNQTHTVAQIYSFVRSHCSDDSRRFKLMTTFPNKDLKEDATTLEDGNLLNAVIVQRFM